MGKIVFDLEMDRLLILYSGWLRQLLSQFLLIFVSF